MRYTDAVDFVFGFTNYEFTPLSAASAGSLRLERLRALLARLGNPQQGRHSVHITGSKGKGSTAQMVATLLRQTGERVGLFTSPHLHSPRERIAIDGDPISEQEFADLTARLQPEVEAVNAQRPDDRLTTFELLTALGFLAFRERGCDWQVIEVGLGGRLDATNVLDEKDVCIFTPISLEHTAILGPTTAAIAADKAGILRRGCRAVMGLQDAEAAAVLRDACAELDVPLDSIEERCTWKLLAATETEQHCQIKTPHAVYSFQLPLLGGFQIENAAAALMAIEALADRGAQLTRRQVAAGFAAVRWPGRVEIVGRRPLVIVDGAHNAASAQRLAETLLSSAGLDTPTLFIIGTLQDKDLDGIVEQLATIAQTVFAVRPNHPRARDPEEIARAFAKKGVTATAAGTVQEGLRAALAYVTPDWLVCVTGSLYVVSEARQLLLNTGPER